MANRIRFRFVFFGVRVSTIPEPFYPRFDKAYPALYPDKGGITNEEWVCKSRKYGKGRLLFVEGDINSDTSKNERRCNWYFL